MKRFKEEVTLIFSVLKWVIYATFAGLIVGSATTGFIKLLNTGIGWTKSLPFSYFYLGFRQENADLQR